MKPANKPARPSTGKRRGAAAVELAVVMPLLVTLLLGVWDIGRLIDATEIVNNAAREGGRYASTGQATVAQVQTAVLDYMKQAGLTTTGAVVTVTNTTDSRYPDPSSATQLNLFSINVTLPSSNVRYIAMSNLLGSSTLQSTTYWNSMRDIPLTVPTDPPIN